MKLTDRMKKILLYLLHPEKTASWFMEKFDLNILSWFNDLEWEIMSFCEKKPWKDFSHSERVSYRRTFRILEKHGLIKRKMVNYLVSKMTHYRLTDSGIRIAEKIEEEIRNIIKEYEYLI